MSKGDEKRRQRDAYRKEFKTGVKLGKDRKKKRGGRKVK
jgi:hypothetical protein